MTRGRIGTPQSSPTPTPTPYGDGAYRTARGFTIVEVLIAIPVIAILATIATLGTTRFLADGRDAQRQASATTLAETLEKYYDQHGEYPSCTTMTDDAATVGATLDVDTSVLQMPRSASENSVSCADLLSTSSDDVLAYVGDGSAQCQTGLACLSWELKYRVEADNTVATISSRRKASVPVAPSAPASTVIATVNSAVATGSASGIGCTLGTPQYQLRSRENESAWSSGTWSIQTVLTVSAREGQQYSFEALTRCVLSDGTLGEATTSNTAIVVRPINTPAAPAKPDDGIASGATTASSITYAYDFTSCPSDTSAKFERRWGMDDTKNGSGALVTSWRTAVASATTSYSVDTSYQGYEYAMGVRVACFSKYTTSNYSPWSEADRHVRTIAKPGTATNFSVKTVDQADWRSGDQLTRWVRVSWTAPSCGSGTTGIRWAQGAADNTSGGGAVINIWNDGSDTADSREHWFRSTFPTSLVDWSGSQGPGGNPKTSNVAPSQSLINNMDVVGVGTKLAYVEPLGWRPVNATSLERARAIVAYACVNPYTERVSYFGNYAVSGISD